jgi:hypothetical protein
MEIHTTPPPEGKGWVEAYEDQVSKSFLEKLADDFARYKLETYIELLEGNIYRVYLKKKDK